METTVQKLKAEGRLKRLEESVVRQAQMTPWAKELREALAFEAAAGWFFYDEETRKRLGEEKARLDIGLILRAIARAGLTLERKPNFAFEEHALNVLQRKE